MDGSETAKNLAGLDVLPELSSKTHQAVTKLRMELEECSEEDIVGVHEANTGRGGGSLAAAVMFWGLTQWARRRELPEEWTDVQRKMGNRIRDHITNKVSSINGLWKTVST